MTRDITSGAITASQAGSGYAAVVLVDLDFPSGHIRVHTGAGDITFNNFLYQGVGDLGGISNVEETIEGQTSRIELFLTGIDPALISTALNENYRHREGVVYLAFIDSNGVLVDDPVVTFRGRMDTMPITLGDTAKIRLRIESRLADWNRARIDRYTNESQQQKFPGDKGLEFVSQMAEKEIVWGSGGTSSDAPRIGGIASVIMGQF